MTKKLYWADSHVKSFTARVIASRLDGDQRVVVLDQTAFYPTGGGQPCDLGRIKSMAVADVSFDNDERVLHRLKSAEELAVGEEVKCEIDWSRRREMIQQHTGQHILSQAFFQLFGAETKGFRITDYSTEIDLALELDQAEIESAITRAEEMANQIVFDNREIRIHEVTPEEAAQLPLRKESFVADCIRVIEIADYDWSPCGGTHAKRTGEVGAIAVRSFERAKKMTRIHFLCGARVLRDYRLANQTASALARQFTVGREEVPASVARLLDENKRLARRIHELAEVAAKVEAQELLQSAAQIAGGCVVTNVFDDRSFDELKLVAHRLVDGDGVIALLGVNEAETSRLVFARSADVTADMSALMKVACEKLGGRGGGKPDFAQGGGVKNPDLEKILADLGKSLRA